jgi:murein DD-endopeptidase MepM/ murein hydrolase activator NlpD
MHLALKPNRSSLFMFGDARAWELYSASHIPASTRAILQRTAVWVLSCAAFVAVSRTLVHDLDVRMGMLYAPRPLGAQLPLPASAIMPSPLPPPPALTGIDNLTIPVVGVPSSTLTRSFTSARSGGRAHHAIDILARRNTPVIAANDGVIVDMSTSGLGGTTISQLDPTGQYTFYYAHLQRYARGLKEGAHVRKGQTIGYVGTTGNAPPETPHLHFAILKVKAPGTWRQGEPIDPYDVLTERHLAVASNSNGIKGQGRTK